jgi:hypothetical protein
MTIDAVRRKSTRASRREQREEMPIGENDANIFDCPTCARPLATGTRRCPGCSTRLLGGVRATRAAGFMAVGLLVGVVVGGGVVGLVAMLSTPTAVVAGTDTLAAGPTSAPLATSAPVSVPVADPAIPAAALTALRQTSLINQRLQSDATRLDAVMAASTPASVDIARALRSLSATAAFGDRIAPAVADWADGTAVSASLAAFYAAVGSTAREGLTSSLQNADAYRDAGRSMLVVLGGLAELDAASRALAATADTDLPALGPTTSAAP